MFMYTYRLYRSRLNSFNCTGGGRTAGHWMVGRPVPLAPGWKRRWRIPFAAPVLTGIMLGAIVVLHSQAAAPKIAVQDAWNALPRYEYGQDMAPLLAIDRVVIKAMASPQSRETCAAQLAGVLTAEETTLAAQQYICLKLRQIGTPAQVPALSELLTDPETSEMARQALQVIPGPAASDALRSALRQLEGTLLVGAINSVAAREDVKAVPQLERLADAKDKEVAAAALWALGNIGNEQASSFLVARAAQAGVPTPRSLAVPLLRSAGRFTHRGQKGSAKAILDELAQEDQAAGTRAAALEGLLHLQGDNSAATVLDWLTSSDKARRQVALGHLRSLSPEHVDILLTRLPDLTYPSQMAVIELAASRRGKKVLPMVMSLIESDNVELKMAGIGCLGMIGDAAAIPTLLKVLGEPDPISAAAQDALLALPRKPVTAALLDALRNRPEIREPVIATLVKLKCYDAIDPLIEIASQPDPSIHEPALKGLRGIADPDQQDIPRLVNLLLKTEPGQHQDEVEKTILLVTEKLPPDADQSKPVRRALESVPRSKAPKYLPLLGRLGGGAALDIIQSGLESSDSEVRGAAVRGLCNWPNAEVADQLLEIAETSQEKPFHRWALRAYVRVVTLESDRPPAETLSMLKHAMELTQVVDDKRLVLQRAATIRTMDTVNWIGQFLDDTELRQTACQAIVELAHHRFLRHPNMNVFDPLLKKVSQVCKDASVVERADRYRLGL
ncbi:MAG: HEAT repeat domain-containing protein [Planctomycetota bacterium]